MKTTAAIEKIISSIIDGKTGYSEELSEVFRIRIYAQGENKSDLPCVYTTEECIKMYPLLCEKVLAEAKKEHTFLVALKIAFALFDLQVQEIDEVNYKVRFMLEVLERIMGTIDDVDGTGLFQIVSMLDEKK